MELLEEIVGDVNRRYLKGVGSKVVVGDEGAWIGVEMDPKRTKIEGEIQYDKGETYKDSEEKGSNPRRDPEDPEEGKVDPNESGLALNQTPREEKRNDNVQRKNTGSKVPQDQPVVKKTDQANDDTAEEVRQVERTPKKPNLSRSPLESPREVSGSPNLSKSVQRLKDTQLKEVKNVEINNFQNTPKKQEFYKRFLEAQKGQTPTPHSFRSSLYDSKAEGRIQYQSEVPEQTIFKSMEATMNLMIDRVSEEDS